MEVLVNLFVELDLRFGHFLNIKLGYVDSRVTNRTIIVAGLKQTVQAVHMNEMFAVHQLLH